MKDPMFQPCAAWAEKLAATHPDDLSPTEWAELEAHIAHCQACAAVRAEYRLMDDRIRNYPAGEVFLHPPSPPPIPEQLTGNDVGSPLPALDRVYMRSLRNRLSWYVPFLSTSPYIQRVSVVILIVIVCLIASLLLGIYFLKTVAWVFEPELLHGMLPL
jgi:anti-sigma factor RsiW